MYYFFNLEKCYILHIGLYQLFFFILSRSIFCSINKVLIIIIISIIINIIIIIIIIFRVDFKNKSTM